MRFVVIGAGAVGGVVGGRLARAGHDVAFVARGAHGERMRAEGLHVHGPLGTDTVRTEVVDRPRAIAWRADDVVLLAVKGQGTVAVLDELAATEADVPVVCLQNGVANEREALRRFPRVQAAVVMCPTVHLEPGHVVAHSAPTTGIIDVGRYPHGVDATTEAVVAALADSTFSALALADVQRWKWAKLVTNLGNAVEAVCGPPARRGPLGERVRAEGEAVLDAAGIDRATPEEDRARRGDHLQLQPVEGTRRPGGSTWQSLARRAGDLETDLLNGEVVLLGRLHGVPTPVNAVLQRLARRLVRSGAPPGSIDEDEVLAALGRS